MKHDVFSPATYSVLEQCQQTSEENARGLIASYFSLSFNSVVALGVCAFEFEIFYRIFSYLAGEDSQFWTPWVMGCSSMILVVAIHTLALRNQDHPVVRIIRRIASTLIPIYLLGIGLLLAAMIYHDGLGDLMNSEDDFGTLLNELNTSPETDTQEGNWLIPIMEHITVPLATLLFSIGIGALAIINVFVGHHAMSTVQQTVTRISQCLSAYRADKEDFALFRQAHQDYDALQEKIDHATMEDDDALRQAIASDTLFQIEQAIAPAHKVLTQLTMDKSEKVSFIHQDNLNKTELEKFLKAIKTITLDTLIKHMR